MEELGDGGFIACCYLLRARCFVGKKTSSKILALHLEVRVVIRCLGELGISTKSFFNSLFQGLIVVLAWGSSRIIKAKKSIL